MPIYSKVLFVILLLLLGGCAAVWNADDEWACAGREDSDEPYTIDYWFVRVFYPSPSRDLEAFCLNARYNALPDNPGLSEEEDED